MYQVLSEEGSEPTAGFVVLEENQKRDFHVADCFMKVAACVCNLVIAGNEHSTRGDEKEDSSHGMILPNHIS